MLIPTTVLTGTSAGGDTIISDQALAVDTQTTTFAGIPATFTHLRLVLMARTDNANNDLGMRFNGDTGANYDWENLLIVGTASGSWTSTQGVGATSFTAGYVGQSTYPADEFGMYVINIPFYRSAHLKKYVAEGHVRAAASSGNIYRIDGGGTWRSTSAITQIELVANSKYIADSRFVLYGVT